MFTFLDLLEGEKHLITDEEYERLKAMYESGDEDGAIKGLDNALKNTLREYVKRRSNHNGL